MESLADPYRLRIADTHKTPRLNDGHISAPQAAAMPSISPVVILEKANVSHQINVTVAVTLVKSHMSYDAHVVESAGVDEKLIDALQSRSPGE